MQLRQQENLMFIKVGLQFIAVPITFRSIRNQQGIAVNLRKSIKVALAQRGISQKALAKQLGMSETGLSQLAAQTSCTGATLQKLADAFDMKVSEFVALGED